MRKLEIWRKRTRYTDSGWIQGENTWKRPYCNPQRPICKHTPSADCQKTKKPDDGSPIDPSRERSRKAAGAEWSHASGRGWDGPKALRTVPPENAKTAIPPVEGADGGLIDGKIAGNRNYGLLAADGAVAAEDTRRRELAQAMADHVFRHEDVDEGFAVMHGERVADKLRHDH